MPQLWKVDVLGGYMYSDQLSDTLRTALQPLTRFRNFCDIQEAKDKGTGDKHNWNVYSDTEEQGGVLDEEMPMPKSRFKVRQESLTVQEYGLSVPYTRKLDILSKHSVETVIHKVLKNDARKVLDAAAHAEFDKTRLYVAPTGGNSATAVTLTTNGATATTNNIEMNKAHVKAIADVMAERNIIPFDGENYCCVARPTTLRKFKDDLEAISFYIESGFSRIAAGEIGRYEGIRFFQQTNIPSEGWTNSKSDAAYFFGMDVVTEAIVEPEQIRASLPGDFGRDRGIAWYFLGGYGICHTDADQSRIIKWASAA